MGFLLSLFQRNRLGENAYLKVGLLKACSTGLQNAVALTLAVLTLSARGYKINRAGS